MSNSNGNVNYVVQNQIAQVLNNLNNNNNSLYLYSLDQIFLLWSTLFKNPNYAKSSLIQRILDIAVNNGTFVDLTTLSLSNYNICNIPADCNITLDTLGIQQGSLNVLNPQGYLQNNQTLAVFSQTTSPLTCTANNLALAYDSNNLSTTDGMLNTIQDINPNSTPTFASATINGTVNSTAYQVNNTNLLNITGVTAPLTSTKSASTDILGLAYNSTNLKITSNALTTSQNLAPTSAPSFTGLNVLNNTNIVNGKLLLNSASVLNGNGMYLQRCAVCGTTGLISQPSGGTQFALTFQSGVSFSTVTVSDPLNMLNSPTNTQFTVPYAGTYAYKVMVNFQTNANWNYIACYKNGTETASNYSTGYFSLGAVATSLGLFACNASDILTFKAAQDSGSSSVIAGCSIIIERLA